MIPVCHDHKGKLYDLRSVPLPNTFIFLKISLFIYMYRHVDVNEKKKETNLVLNMVGEKVGYKKKKNITSGRHI